MKQKKGLQLIIAFLVSSLNALCCDCGRDRITVESFNSYDWIFTGTLLSEIKVGENRGYRTAIYKVIKAYRGVQEGDTVQINDAESFNYCGLGPLKKGRDYLIYAKKAKEGQWTSNCTGTTIVPYYVWPRDSALINKMKSIGYAVTMGTTKTIQGKDSMYYAVPLEETHFHADTVFLNKHVLNVHHSGVQKFYDFNGEISAKGRYHNGLPEGLWTYYERGEMSSKGKYVGGKKDSLWVEISLYVEIKEYKAGEFTYRQTSIDKGRLKYKAEPIGNGEKWVEYDYHGNGRLRYIAYSKPPERDKKDRLRQPRSEGPFKMFNTKGIVLQDGNKANGVETGHWKYYYENGKLRMEGDYIQVQKQGDFIRSQKNDLWKIYYPNNTIKATGVYRDGEKAGVWKYYNEQGKEVAPDPELIKEDEDWFTYSAATG